MKMIDQPYRTKSSPPKQYPQVYAITGWKFHGKDLFARTVMSFTDQFIVIHFADALKEMTSSIFGLTSEQQNDSKLKEVPFATPIRMDDHLPEMRRVVGLYMQPKGLVAKTPRQVLQYFGTDYVRSVQDNYWTTRVLEQIANHQGKVLIADCRFLNEAKVIRSIGGKVIRVLRTDLVASDDIHASEREIAEIVPDLTISKVNSDLVLQTKIAKLIATNRFDEALKYGLGQTLGEHEVKMLKSLEHLRGHETYGNTPVLPRPSRFENLKTWLLSKF